MHNKIWIEILNYSLIFKGFIAMLILLSRMIKVYETITLSE